MAQKKALKRRLYNVAAAAHYLLDEQNSLYIRAIKLYEMQIAVYFGEKLNERQRKRKEFPDRWLAVSSDLLAAARVCSAIRLVQHIRKTRHLDETSLPSLLDDPAVREVLGRLLEEPVGLRKLAIALRPHSLDIKLRNRRRRQQRYAPLYDVSLRWPLGPGSNFKGGWTTAQALFNPRAGSPEQDIVRKHYPKLRSAWAANKWADTEDFQAGFVWLNNFGGERFRPHEVGKVNFAKKLLANAQDVPELTRLFGRYEFIKRRLTERNYRLLALDFKQPVPLITSVISPLSEDLLDAISKKESVT